MRWLIALGVTVAMSLSAETKADEIQRTLFVAPLENETGQTQYDAAAAGIADLIGATLASAKNVTVLDRERLHALTKEQKRSISGLVGDAGAVKTGKLLMADTVLTGRLSLVEGMISVSVKALHLADERVTAADQFSCEPAGLATAVLKMSRRVALALALPLPAARDENDETPIASLHFAKGLGHYYAGNMDGAVAEFFRTLDQDPDYLDAQQFCGLAFFKLGEFDHAIIEWEALLKRLPDQKRAAEVTKLLEEARKKASQH